MTSDLQDLIRLLADYRHRLDSGDSVDSAQLLRALIAEIEGLSGEGRKPDR